MLNRMKAGGTAPPSAVSYSDAKRSAATPLRPIERLVGQLVGEVFHFGFGRHYDLRHDVLLCRAQLQKALRSKQAALRLMHNRMKAGGTAPPSAVSYWQNDSSAGR